MAHFDQHPGIVTVKNFFRAHGTGYCVMDYVEGITLSEYLGQQPNGRISFDAALKLLMPVMDALRAVHKEGLLHRDIAPDNIYLTQDGRIKLLDFGAARYAASEHSKSLSIILKPGYAPEEQYRTKGNQGPWTDVYGLAATFYRTITGKLPPESLDRLDADELILPSKLGVDIKPEQEEALLKGLAIKASQRFQSMAELQEVWRSRMQIPPPKEHQGDMARGTDLVAQPYVPSKQSSFGGYLAIAGKLILIIFGGLFLIGIWQIFPLPPHTAVQHALQSVTTSPPPQLTPTVTVPNPRVPLHQSSKNKAEAFDEGVRAYEQEDFERAHAIFRPLAEDGNANAQFNIGLMYVEGKGIIKDEIAGAYWYRKAAEQGITKAQVNLGLAYSMGQGVTQDEAEAVRWYRKAAEKGDAIAQFNLGLAYSEGNGITKDDVEAVRWYRKAAEQGVTEAQYYLGIAFAYGEGVSKDVAEAVHWFRNAAEQGHVDAQYNIGISYYHGFGAAKDQVEAVRWFRKAAEQGLASAQFKLGDTYVNGEGVAQNKQEAIKWYKEAAKQDHAGAKAALKQLGK